MKTINDITRKNPFKIPENYFDEVNRKILTETSDTVNVTASKGLYRRIKPLLAVAASLAFLMLLSYTVVRIINPADKKEIFPVISLEDFPEGYINEIDITTLEENVSRVVLYDRMPDVSSEDIIEYLVLNDLDANEIYEIF